MRAQSVARARATVPAQGPAPATFGFPAYIIDEGRVLSEGSREFLLNDPIAREIYLGHRFSM